MTAFLEKVYELLDERGVNRSTDIAEALDAAGREQFSGEPLAAAEEAGHAD